MAPEQEERARSAPWFRRALLVAGATFVALLGAELGYRGWLAIRGRAYDAPAAAERLQALATTMNESMPRLDHGTGEEPYDGRAVHPYIGIDQRASMRMSEDEARRFLDGTYDDAFVVLVVGGSVAAQVATFESAHMVEALARDPRLAGREVRVLSQGRGSLKEPQQATMLAYLYALGWRPDVVVNVDGFNELALAWDNLENDVHPLHPAYSAWALIAARRSNLSLELRQAGAIDAFAREARALADRALSGSWMESAIYGRVQLARATALENAWADAQKEYQSLLIGGEQRNPAKGPRFEQRGDAAWSRLIRAWSEGSLCMKGMCDANDTPYLHILQPTLHDEGSKPLTAEEVATSGCPPLWIRVVGEGYPKLRAEGEVLGRRGVRFVDLSRIFADYHETTYFDACHMRGPGHQMFAERIAAEILRCFPGEIPRPRAAHVR